VIYLSVGETWTQAAPGLIAALAHGLPRSCHGYILSPHGLPALQRVLREYVARTHLLSGAFRPGVDYEVAVSPERDGLGATLHLPPGVVPVRATPAGTQPNDRWHATYLAIPPEGITFRARVPAAASASLTSAVVVIGSWALPGTETSGTATRRLLPWLPQERTDWISYAQWVVAPESAVEPPLPPVEAPATSPMALPSVPAPGPPPAAPAPAPAQPAPAQPPRPPS